MIIKMKKEILDRLEKTEEMLGDANAYERERIEERIAEIKQSYIFLQRLALRGKGRKGYSSNINYDLI